MNKRVSIVTIYCQLNCKKNTELAHRHAYAISRVTEGSNLKIFIRTSAGIPEPEKASVCQIVFVCCRLCFPDWETQLICQIGKNPTRFINRLILLYFRFLYGPLAQ